MILGGFILLGFSRQYCFLFPLSFNSVSLKTVVITTKALVSAENVFSICRRLRRKIKVKRKIFVI